jgi:hypothetical protein
MTANREPSNQSFETDGEATVCTASRRFLPFCSFSFHRKAATISFFSSSLSFSLGGFGLRGVAESVVNSFSVIALRVGASRMIEARAEPTN